MAPVVQPQGFTPIPGQLSAQINIMRYATAGLCLHGGNLNGMCLSILHKQRRLMIGSPCEPIGNLGFVTISTNNLLRPAVSFHVVRWKVSHSPQAFEQDPPDDGLTILAHIRR